MSTFISTLLRSHVLRNQNIRWIALSIVSLLTNAALAQSHQNLASVIASGNEALSEAVYGLHATAYVNGSGIQVAGEGEATTLDLTAFNFGAVNFSDSALNTVNTVILRFENASQAALAIDGGSLSALENLSNVVLLFTYDLTVAEASSLPMSSLPAGVTSYYSISIPE